MSNPGLHRPAGLSPVAGRRRRHRRRADGPAQGGPRQYRSGRRSLPARDDGTGPLRRGQRTTHDAGRQLLLRPRHRRDLPQPGCPLLNHRSAVRQPAEAHRGHTRGRLDAGPLLDGRRRQRRLASGPEAIAHNLARWKSRIGLGEQVVTTKTLRRRFFSLAGRLTRSSRHLTLHLPRHWPWEAQFTGALTRLRTLAASLLTVGPAPLSTSQSKISPTRAARIGQRRVTCRLRPPHERLTKPITGLLLAPPVPYPLGQSPLHPCDVLFQRPPRSVRWIRVKSTSNVKNFFSRLPYRVCDFSQGIRVSTSCLQDVADRILTQPARNGKLPGTTISSPWPYQVSDPILDFFSPHNDQILNQSQGETCIYVG